MSWWTMGLDLDPAVYYFRQQVGVCGRWSDLEADGRGVAFVCYAVRSGVRVRGGKGGGRGRF